MVVERIYQKQNDFGKACEYFNQAKDHGNQNTAAEIKECCK